MGDSISNAVHAPAGISILAFAGNKNVYQMEHYDQWASFNASIAANGTVPVIAPNITQTVRLGRIWLASSVAGNVWIQISGADVIVFRCIVNQMNLIEFAPYGYNAGLGNSVLILNSTGSTSTIVGNIMYGIFDS